MVTKMMGTAPATPLETFPGQGEWTYDHWLKFPDDGWKYEIINGVLYMSPPPAIAHQNSSGELFVRMRLHAIANNLGLVLAAPCGVKLPNHPVPVQPDIFFIKKERLDIIGEQYIEGAPDLIVEILSPSNPLHDRTTKYNAYQDAGVPEYWLVDYRAKTVEIYHLVDKVYMLTGKYTGKETAVSTQLIGFKIVVETIQDLRMSF